MSVSTSCEHDEQAVKTIKLVAAAARTKGDPVYVALGNATFGVNNDATITDATTVKRLAVAMQNAASGAVYEAATHGTVDLTVPEATYTTGDGLLILDGAVTDSATAAVAPTGVSTLNDFAIIKEGGTTVTTIRATLYGEPFTGTT